VRRHVDVLQLLLDLLQAAVLKLHCLCDELNLPKVERCMHCISCTVLQLTTCLFKSCCKPALSTTKHAQHRSSAIAYQARKVKCFVAKCKALETLNICCAGVTQHALQQLLVRSSYSVWLHFELLSR
jgi:hypothetical protein